MTDTAATHRLRGNAAERSPRRLIVFDTETRWQTGPLSERHVLRCWAAQLIMRDPKRAATVAVTEHEGDTAAGFAELVDTYGATSPTLWVAAHNLGFDLIVTRLVPELLSRGWELGDHALTQATPWARLRRSRQRLVLADTASWLPASVDAIGRLLGIEKPPLPDNDDTPEAWRARCHADVQITAAGLCELLDWWDRNRLGCWSVTGAATGWNAYRHRLRSEVVTIDPDPEARAFERRALYGGRRECWRVGALPRGRYVELDIERAHLTAARWLPLPAKRIRAFGPVAVDALTCNERMHGSIADVTVRTESPRYPVVVDRRVWHPVGTFRTVLAGPELAEARARGELVAVHGGYRYRLTHSMTEWATWLVTVLDGLVDDSPPMAQLAAKAWSRRVPGKWATRITRLVETLETPEPGWSLDRGWSMAEGARLSVFHAGSTVQMLVHDQEADDSFPAVLAWIQSAVRVALGRLVDRLGDERMVSCNTDGLIVRAARTPDAAKLSALVAPFVVRVKAVYHAVDVVSPQHLVLDGAPRLAGVPATATPDGEARFTWLTWPGLARQLSLSPEAGYTRERRVARLDNVPVQRWVRADGRTMPPRAAVAASEGLVWVHPHSDPSVGADVALRPSQSRTLARVDAPLLTA